MFPLVYMPEQLLTCKKKLSMVAYLVAPQDLQVVIAVCNESIFPINCLHERNALLVTPLNNSNELVKSLHRQTGQNKRQSTEIG